MTKNKQNRWQLLILLTSCFLLPYSLFAQHIQVQKTDSAALQQFVQQLVGEGVIIKKFRFNLPPSTGAYGYYEDSKELLGIQKGILLTSGSIFNFTNSYPYQQQKKWGKSKGDKILSSLLDKKPKTFDACVLEMEIVPLADTLCFNFVFGSEEYDAFVGSPFNDTFGFFLLATQERNVENIGVVPYTNIPIAINNVNGGNTALPEYVPQNPTFYVRNSHKFLNYGGFTKLIQVRKYVKRKATYLLRVAIADVSDGILDSGVIIEGKSLMSYFQNIHINFATNSSVVDKKFYKELDETIDYIKAMNYKEYKILVAGHTDSDGSEVHNHQLSKHRVDETVAYFVKNGFRKEQFIVEYRGETMPIASNDTAAGKQRNRRVEIRILGASYVTQPTQ
jgi:outer membrane protein OmpA-like peptidoglycan-associated protein